MRKSGVTSVCLKDVEKLYCNFYLPTIMYCKTFVYKLFTICIHVCETVALNAIEVNLSK